MRIHLVALSLLILPACTHINVKQGSTSDPKTASMQTRKVNYLFWMFLNMQRAASARDVCYPLAPDSFSIGMDAIDWLLSAGTGGLYVQQTVSYRCSPAPETKKVSKNP